MVVMRCYQFLHEKHKNLHQNGVGTHLLFLFRGGGLTRAIDRWHSRGLLLAGDLIFANSTAFCLHFDIDSYQIRSKSIRIPKFRFASRSVPENFLWGFLSSTKANKPLATGGACLNWAVVMKPQITEHTTICQQRPPDWSALRRSGTSMTVQKFHKTQRITRKLMAKHKRFSVSNLPRKDCFKPGNHA